MILPHILDTWTLHGSPLRTFTQQLNIIITSRSHHPPPPPPSSPKIPNGQNFSLYFFEILPKNFSKIMLETKAQKKISNFFFKFFFQKNVPKILQSRKIARVPLYVRHPPPLPPPKKKKLGLGPAPAPAPAPPLIVFNNCMNSKKFWPPMSSFLS